MGLERRFRIYLCTMGIFKMGISMEKGNCSGRKISLIMKAIFNMGLFKEMEYIILKMGGNIKENGSIIKCMGMEKCTIRMLECIRGSLKMMLNVEKEK